MSKLTYRVLSTLELTGQDNNNNKKNKLNDKNKWFNREEKIHLQHA